MTERSDTDVIGINAMAVGGLLVLGALMFLAVTLMSGTSRVVMIPPAVQIALGCRGSMAGYLLRQGHAMAKFALWFAVGVVANLVLFVAIAVATMV
jgi:hypothetical protein